jgi:4-hydroxybenzoate polyprenyltransferase
VQRDSLRGVSTGAPQATATSRRTALPLLVLETMRPRQWTKNAFVLAALIFAGDAFHVGDELAAWRMVIAFCLGSGVAYLINDAGDAEVDRHNPRTATRPIARGDLSPRAAIVSAIVITIVALGIALTINWKSAVVLAAYIALQLAYSAGGLKHMILLDVLVVSGGFVLRALGGAVAIDVRMSDWLLVCTGLLALFLALGKRRAEVIALGGQSAPTRPVLDGYSVEMLDQMINVVTPATVVVYIVYAVLGTETSNMLLTVPFVIYGVFRVLLLIHRGSGQTEEPDMVVWRDRPLLACVLAWGVTALIIAAIAAS